MEAKHNRFNGHTWIVFIVMITCITLISLAIVAVMTYLMKTEPNEGTRVMEGGVIGSTIFFAIKGYVIAMELLTGRDITEKIEPPKKD